ncbi:MAG: ABC transporter permease, partial [Stenotrophomonas nitritireducens]|nr:ABC transporter permease [Stenotrophomonas nitritireducens]
MFAYYFKLALRSFRRNKVLTALMVLAIALGIGAALTTLTVFKVLSGDPIPHKSERLFYVQLDPYTRDGYKPGEEPEQQLTRFDAEELLRQKKAPRQAMMTGGDGIVDPRVDALKPFSVGARFTSGDFFPMFDTPFLYGQGWSGAEDTGHARVAVIGRTLNEKLFKGENSVGREVLFEGHPLRIVGVLDTWSPQPLFYDVFVGKFDRKEEVF